MNRTIGGLPILYWAVGLGVGVIGFLWIKKRSGGSTTTAAAAKPNPQAFTQAQEVQDFQVFSALTGAQQASDLNFLSEVAGLFSGGSSTGTPGSTGGGTGGGTTPFPVSSPLVPAPPSTGTFAPTTISASSASSPTAAFGSTDPQVQQAEAILAAAGAGSGPNGERRAVA